MFKSIIKVISLLLIIGLNWTGLSFIGTTLAYFNDEEDSQSNAIVVATLDFSLSSASDFSPEVSPVQSTSRTIDLINSGSLGFKYNVYASQFSGDSNLCSALSLTANLDGGSVEYSGTLTGFNFNNSEFSQPESWNFIVSLPPNASTDLENKTCHFKFIFEAVQLGECTGFSDVEEIDNNISSSEWIEKPKMLINKVYYDVDPDHGTEPANEWVELYNSSDSGIDINDWTIEDNDSSDVISISSLVVPAHGYVIITGSASTWNYWTIPTGTIKIVLAGGEIGDGLNNGADMLALKNSDGIIVDQMNWGTPNPGWPNYNSNLWNPGIPIVLEGHMLGRVPVGYDTNRPSDFKDLALPTVTVTYPGTVWSCNGHYNIFWTAINNNGSDSELLIDVIYITDNDRNAVISSGDNVFLIAEKIANVSPYNFYIDFSKGYCYLGYVWMKIVAYGPENFMVQDPGLGPRVYEPPAPEDCPDCQIEPEIIEESIVEEPPVVEETLPVEEPATGEPVIEEPVVEEPLPEEPLPEETLPEEPIEEASADEMPIEESASEETEIIEPEEVFVPEDSPVIEETTEENSGSGEPPTLPSNEETYE